MIEIYKPKFVVGDEKRVLDFIKNLNDKDNIALVSHTDLDGIGAAKIVNEVVDARIVKFVNYKDINLDLVEELKKENIEKVIFTDLYFKDKLILSEINKFAQILIIDHHPFDIDYNSEKIIFMNSSGKGFCATYLCYYLLSKIKNLEYYDWLVASACLADYCYKSNQNWMKQVYKKYGDEFEMEDLFVRKSGKMWDLQYKLSLFIIYYDDNLKEVYEKINRNLEKIDNFNEYSSKVLLEIESALKKFEKEKIKINDGYLWEITPHFHIKSILINEISARYIDKT